MEELVSRQAVHSERGMHYPVRWDPFLRGFMTLADIYHYPTQHFGRMHLAPAGLPSRARSAPAPLKGQTQRTATTAGASLPA